MNGKQDFVHPGIDSCEVICMKDRKFGTMVLAGFGMLVLILDGKTALLGMRDGLEICLWTVIPALFPFLLY